LTLTSCNDNIKAIDSVTLLILGRRT